MTEQEHYLGSGASPSGAPTTNAPIGSPKCRGCKQCVQHRSQRIIRLPLEEETRAALERESGAGGVEAVIDEAGRADAEARSAAALALRLPTIAPALDKDLLQARDGNHDAVYVQNLPRTGGPARIVLRAISQRIGELYNFSSQCDGQIVMAIAPTAKSGANTHSSPDQFGWHSDDAAVPRAFRTDWIVLYGIRNPPGTTTSYAAIGDAVAELRPSYSRALREARFSVRVPVSFGMGDQLWSGPRPILTFDESGRTEIAWPSYATRILDPTDQEAGDALRALGEAVQRHASHFTVDPGCLLAFSNGRGVHMRSRIGPGDRLVYRTYVRHSLADLKRATGEPGPVFDVSRIL